MAVNHKLTNVVKDRVVQDFQLNAPDLLITFVDGSTMNIKNITSMNARTVRRSVDSIGAPGGGAPRVTT